MALQAMPDFGSKCLRALGVDDGSFVPKQSKNCLLVGVVLRADNRVEGVLSCTLQVDGMEATECIVDMVLQSRFASQIAVVFLSGLNFAGFNMVNIKALSNKLKRPVIVVMKKQPKFERIKAALSALPHAGYRLKILEDAGDVMRVGNIYCQLAGITPEHAEKAIKAFTFYSHYPEPVRLAHIIASGISRGESAKP
jgi:hypothetical protein